MCACRRCSGPTDDIAGDSFPAEALRGIAFPEAAMPGLVLAVWRLGVEYSATDVIGGTLSALPVMALR